MAYIGNSPIVGNFQVCDAISVVNGQAAYTMQVDSANVTPESANHMLVSLNGILQKPGSSFTISGSTITFASNLATGDVIDFIMLLGNVLDLGVPSDATVTNAKTNFTSTSSAAGLQIKGDGTTDGTLQLNCSQNSHGIKLASPAHSAGQSYTLTFPTGNVTAGTVLKVASISGSGTTATGQLSFGSGGGLVHIKTQTISSGVSSVDFIHGTSDVVFDSTYNAYKLVISDMHVATDNQKPHIRFKDDGDFMASNYQFTGMTRDSGNNSDFFNSTSDSDIRTLNDGIGNASDESFGAEIYFHKPSTTDTHKLVHGTISGLEQNGQAIAGYFSGTNHGNTNALTGFQIRVGSGNIDRGNFSLYGLSTS
jgi:hypothetical protein